MPSISKNPRVISHAERILEMHPEIRTALETTDQKIRAVMTPVFADELIRENFKGAQIRWNAMCGEVGREILATLNQDPNLIGLMSIGDIDLPPFAREVADEIVESAHIYHRELIAEEGYGYDLTSQGSPSARAAMIRFFDSHYNFSAIPGLIEKLNSNSTIISGGMRGLDDIATAFVSIANNESTEENPKKHRFIHPDNSFGTWHQIAKERSFNGVMAEVHNLPTAQKDLLHLTPEQIDEFYDQNPITTHYNDSWCITPVGNPSGTFMEADQLTETCSRIVARNPQATIVLDCTYVRTLKAETAQSLTEGILNNSDVLNRIIFLESFSKTHGFAGERLGAYFSANSGLFDSIQNYNMILSAGNGRIKSAMVLALSTPTEDQRSKIEKLHAFWSKEKQGLYKYLIENDRFSHLFDPNQSHINPEQLKQPLGLYILLKLKEGVNSQQVLAETGCLGVESKMGSGTYVRFAVGKINKATYAKYLEESPAIDLDSKFATL